MSTERPNFSFDWKKYYDIASSRVGGDPEGTLWKSTYIWQMVLTEMHIKELGMKNVFGPVSDIPDINRVLNNQQINPKKELALIEVIGMPGAGKDTAIQHIKDLGYKDVVTSPEEGYAWINQESPFKSLSMRHYQAYGGEEMETDEVIEKLANGRDVASGVGLVNRSNQDNFLAFGYSFFLAGYMSLRDLLTSQRMFHFFQYSQKMYGSNSVDSIDNLTKGIIVCMIKPEVTLTRIPRRGRILCEEFLSLLYLQYLRMISRLRAGHWQNLAVLDMSGTVEENNGLFDSTFRAMVKTRQ